MFTSLAMYGSPPPPPAAAASSSLSRSSAFILGNSASPDYYTIPTANLHYPLSDWSEVFCIKINNANSSLTQYLLGSGNTGSGNCVNFLLSGNQLQFYIIPSTDDRTFFQTGNTVIPGIAKDAGWYYICLRYASGNLEIAACPKGGTASTGISYAPSGMTAITPSTTNLTIGCRASDFTNNAQRNNFAYYARFNSAITNAQLQNMAAGQDIIADLALSPLCYIKFDGLSSVITDLGTSGSNATKVGGPAPRGGPTFTTAPVTIDKGFDNWYGRTFQRSPGGTSATVTATGTYTGSPKGIKVRVLNKSGTQVAAPVNATYPSSGHWSASLSVPQGGEYTLEAYYSNDTTKFARSQLPWGVGMLYLLSGESLSDQQAVNSYTESGFAPVFEQLSIYDQPDSWTNNASYTASPTQGWTDPDLGSVWTCNTSHTSPASGSFAAARAANPSYWTQADISICVTDSINAPNGLVLHTIERLRANLGIPVMCVIGAKTGSQLVNTPNNWNTYSDPVTHGKLKAAILNNGGDMEAVGWNQGANDANISSGTVTQTAFQTDLQNVIPQIRSYVTKRTSANLPAFISIPGSNSSNNSTFDALWRVVRNATVAAIPNIANAFHAGGLWDLVHDAGNGLHPTAGTTGYFRMLKRMAQAILNYYLPGSFPTGSKGESEASVTISGAHTIDVTFSLNAGTTLEGLTGATGLTGFAVTNGSTAQTITATSIPSANTVRLTFSGAPASGWTVDYIPTEFPDPTNLVYCNAPVIGDTAGIPVLPFTAPVTL